MSELIYSGIRIGQDCVWSSLPKGTTVMQYDIGHLKSGRATWKRIIILIFMLHQEYGNYIKYSF